MPYARAGIFQCSLLETHVTTHAFLVESSSEPLPIP